MNNRLKTLKTKLAHQGITNRQRHFSFKTVLGNLCSDSSLFFLTNKQDFKEKLTVSNTAFESPNAFHSLDVF